VAPPAESYWSRQKKALVPFALWGAYGLFFAGHVLFRSAGDELLSWRSAEAADRFFTGGNPSLWLQQQWHSGQTSALDRTATAAHILWFLFPLAAGLAITVFRRDLLVRYLIWLTVTWYAADVFFLLVPTMPPWMVEPEISRILYSAGWIEYASHDSNPVAAFPSLHAAVPAVMAAFFRVHCPHRRWPVVVCGAFSLWVGVAVIYLGEHWVVDVAAGYALAAAIAWGLTRPPVAALTARVFGGHASLQLRTPQFAAPQPGTPGV